MALKHLLIRAIQTLIDLSTFEYRLTKKRFCSSNILLSFFNESIWNLSGLNLENFQGLKKNSSLFLLFINRMLSIFKKITEMNFKKILRLVIRRTLPEIDIIYGDQTNKEDKNLTTVENEKKEEKEEKDLRKYNGISFNQNAKRFQSRIRLQNQQFHLGYFSTPVEAAVAFDECLRTFVQEKGKITKRRNFYNVEDHFDNEDLNIQNDRYGPFLGVSRCRKTRLFYGRVIDPKSSQPVTCSLFKSSVLAARWHDETVLDLWKKEGNLKQPPPTNFPLEVYKVKIDERFNWKYVRKNHLEVIENMQEKLKNIWIKLMDLQLQKNNHETFLEKSKSFEKGQQPFVKIDLMVYKKAMWRVEDKKSENPVYRGVSFIKKKRKWQAQIFFDGKKRHLGYFKKQIHGAVIRDLWIRNNSFSKKKRLQFLNFFCSDDYFDKSEVEADKNNFVGVSFNKMKGLYQSYTTGLPFEQLHLGCFCTAVQAAQSHDKAVLQLWTEGHLPQCRLPATNFPPQDYDVTVPKELEWDYLKKRCSAELNWFFGTK